jgi:HEAT repeat protein
MTDQTARQILRLKEAQLILRDLLKVIKVVSMYPENNPLPQSLRRTFAEKLVAFVDTHGDLRLSINRDTITLDDETVFTDFSKEEALAGIFFGAGITCLSLLEGLDVPQVYKFLDIFKQYLNNRSQSSDLVTQMWEAGMSCISLTTVEDIALSEYDGDFKVQEILRAPRGGRAVGPTTAGDDRVEGYDSLFRGEIDLGDDSGGIDPEPSTGRHFRPGTVEHGSVSLGDMASSDGAGPQERNLIVHRPPNEAEVSNASGLGDLTPSPRAPRVAPQASLIMNDEFKLSEEEEDQIRKVLAEDANFDYFDSSIELLKELLHQEPEMEAFFETVTICEKIHGDFVEMGRLIEAAHLLEYYRMLEDQIRHERPLWAERLRDARATAGSRQRLKSLAESVNAHSDLGTADLRRYLEHFGWEALNAIADLLGELEHRHHRMALCDYLADRGRENLDFVSKGIFDKRWFVVRNTVVILAKIGDDRSLGYLMKAVNHEEFRVRLQLSDSLRESKSDKALDILAKLALDPERKVRDGAIHSIVARRGQRAYSGIANIINSERFPTLDHSEQELLLNAYSALGGEHAVEFLHKLITQLNPFNDPLKAFFRKAAFEALSINRSQKAEKLLVELSNSWLLEVKKFAQAALKKRRDLIFGGNDVDDNRA